MFQVSLVYIKKKSITTRATLRTFSQPSKKKKRLLSLINNIIVYIQDRQAMKNLNENGNNGNLVIHLHYQKQSITHIVFLP